MAVSELRAGVISATEEGGRGKKMVKTDSTQTGVSSAIILIKMSFALFPR